mmetsp:Transcript_34776/g.73397  ORF Transcript_34776/g.73397 Transcript_34776/m.73397 type:complete len:82 (+) Transcript_34776:174-419(+)
MLQHPGETATNFVPILSCLSQYVTDMLPDLPNSASRSCVYFETTDKISATLPIQSDRSKSGVPISLFLQYLVLPEQTAPYG